MSNSNKESVGRAVSIIIGFIDEKCGMGEDREPLWREVKSRVVVQIVQQGKRDEVILLDLGKYWDSEHCLKILFKNKGLKLVRFDVGLLLM